MIWSPTFAPALTRSTVTVTAKDANGNAATGYVGTVAFTLGQADAGATFSPNNGAQPRQYTFTAGDAGTKNFSVTFTTAQAEPMMTTAASSGSVMGGRGSATAVTAGARFRPTAASSRTTP